MSTPVSVAAVTLALRGLLTSGVPASDPSLVGIQVTTRPPDQARTNAAGASLNLFLYRTVHNAAHLNLDPPSVRPGEAGFPSLGLDLHYLLTAYDAEDGDDTASSHRVLGAAMSVLHDHPVLDGGEIDAALAGSGLGEQVDRVRVTPMPLSVDDLSRLWGGFATQYRLSVAYVASVVVIDSRRPVRSALPVLTRGQDDEGVRALPGAGPVLRSLLPPRSQSAVRLGEELVVDGVRVGEAATAFRFTSLMPDPMPSIELARRAPRPDEPPDRVVVRIDPVADDPDALSRWAPGFFSVTATIPVTGLQPLVSNAVAVAVAPELTVSPRATDGPAAPGSTLTVTCAPRLQPGQQASLLLGGQHLTPTSLTTPADPTQPTTLTFEVPDVPPGSHPVRLRVDGVDSIPVTYAGDPPVPSFDPDQLVAVP